METPRPLFQQRCAIISLRYMGYSLSHLALGNQDAADKWAAAAQAYAALATTKIESPIIQGALNAQPFPKD